MYLRKSELLILFDARDDFRLSVERHGNTLSYAVHSLYVLWAKTLRNWIILAAAAAIAAACVFTTHAAEHFL